jgi:hypothetical protein
LLRTSSQGRFEQRAEPKQEQPRTFGQTYAQARQANEDFAKQPPFPQEGGESAEEGGWGAEELAAVEAEGRAIKRELGEEGGGGMSLERRVAKLQGGSTPVFTDEENEQLRQRLANLSPEKQETTLGERIEARKIAEQLEDFTRK